MIFVRLSRGGRLVWGVLVLVVLALALGVLWPSLVKAQPAPAAAGSAMQYVYLLGTDTLATERVTLTNTAALGVLQYRNQPRVEWSHAMSNGRLGALTLKVFAPGAAEGATAVQEFVFTPQGDSVIVAITQGGGSRQEVARSRAGALPVMGRSVLHTALLAAQARRLELTSAPLFMTSGGQTMDATFAFRGDTSTTTLAGLTIQAIWANGVPVEILVPAQNLRAVRVASSAPTLPSTAEVISYAAPANAPYTSEDVTIPTPHGFTLAGTLTRPRGVSGRVPVVVTISGSGPQDRDSRIATVRGYAPFRDFADTLGRRGIAVLRYDDRGVGASGGKGALRDTATSADFAADVASVVAYLRTRPDVDSTRIALMGHSEGGLIAPLAAAADARVRAVVLLAGPAYNGRRILEYQNGLGIAAAPGLSDRQRDSLRATVPAALDSLARSNRWMGYFMATDPLATARRLRQPVLIVQGNTDMQVTPEQADTLASAMRAAGNRQVTLRRFPGVNHLLLNDPSGAPQGYGTLPDTRVRRDVLGTVADWLVQTLKR
ncbi:MAG: alpha/beta fold hydrolase [Gemmatimonadaceae bacterium]|nr:alpha/beta fold hydrolase [Gemmatimonadaceae bacterium]